MKCLYCGDCCLRLSPYSAPDPCDKIHQEEDFFFCSDYENRPGACVKHKMPFQVCPVGITKLNLTSPLSVSLRIKDGDSALRAFKNNLGEEFLGGTSVDRLNDNKIKCKNGEGK